MCHAPQAAWEVRPTARAHEERVTRDQQPRLAPPGQPEAHRASALLRTSLSAELAILGPQNAAVPPSQRLRTGGEAPRSSEDADGA